MRLPGRLALALALSALSALGGSHLRGNGKDLFWPDGKVKLRLSRTVHWDGGDTGVDKREPAASVHASAFRAIRSWMREGRAKVELELDFTDAQSVSAGENIVTFTDPAPFDTGVCDKKRFIACTIVSFTEGGSIASAAVAFNPYKRHSSIGLADTHDIGLIMMHEMGHVLGLGHSFIGDSVMQGAAELEPAPGAPAMFPVHRLGEDDLNTLASLYPAGLVAAISGVVRRGGSPVAGVRVMAIDANGRVPCGVYSSEDGTFRLPLSPGAYVVAAEPTDGPAVVSAAPVQVEEGVERGGEELVVTQAAKLVVDSVGLVLGGLYIGLPRADLARGRDFSLALTRQPLNSPVELLLPAAALEAAGAVSSPASAPQLARLAVRVQPEAPPGAYAMIVRSGEAATVLPAALRIVTNPRIDSVGDAETGEAVEVLRSGRRYAIRGADFAGSEATAPPEFEGAPFPAQLNGIAVRLAERFLPILSVKPDAVVFELPAAEAVSELREGKLAVVTGTFMESNSIPVRLALE